MPKKAENIDFKGFIQLFLSDADVEAIKSKTKETSGWADAIEAWCQDGYKVIVGHDWQAGTHKCSVMDIKPSRASAGWMLTGEAPEYWLAVMVAWYKHEVLMSHDWTDFCTDKKPGSGLR